MSNPLEQKEDVTRIILMAALIELPFLMAGVAAFLMTDKIFWIPVSAIAGSMIMVPALFRVKRIKEREHASR